MFDAPFPEISEARDKPAAAGSHPVQQQAIAASAVAKVDLLALALSRFGDWRASAAALVERYRAVAFDLATPKGYAELTKAIAEVRAPRFAAQNVSKASKSELSGISKAIGAEEAAVAAFLADTETRLVALRDAHDEKVKAEKAEAKRLEDERVAKHQTGIATIRSFLGRCQGLPAARIALGIEQLTGQVYGDDWQEFAVPAASAQCETLEAMRTLHAHAVEREAEAARLDAQRLENERVAADLAAQQAALDAQAATLRNEQARIKGHQARIAEIHAAAAGHDTATAADLSKAMVAVAALDVSEAQYQEYTELAMAAQNATLAALQAQHFKAVEREEAIESVVRQRAVTPAENVATAEATEGKAETPAPGTLEAAPDASATIPAGVFAMVVPAESTVYAQLSEPAMVEPGVTLFRGEVGQIDAGITFVESPAMTHAVFLALVMTAFDCKFLSHPKPSQEWWDKVRAAGQALQQRGQ